MGLVPRYHHSMVDYIREFMLCGLTGNAAVADILSQEYDRPIGAEHVAAWRRMYRRFDIVCTHALTQFQAQCMGVIGQAVADGDVATAKWAMERTNPAFRPSAKVEHGGRIEGLGDMLARRVSEDELRKQGILTDDDE